MSEYAFKEPQSRNEALLQNVLGADNVIGDPQSRIEELLQELDGELDKIEQEIKELTNTTYEFGEGDTDGTIKVTPSDGEPEDVPVKGLESGAFTQIPSDAKFTDTTYEFGQGDTDGTIKVTPSGGTAEDVPVKGLNNGAFTSITASTVDLTPGTSALESGALYFVYE